MNKTHTRNQHQSSITKLVSTYLNKRATENVALYSHRKYK
jgi:hypothetical protein